MDPADISELFLTQPSSMEETDSCSNLFQFGQSTLLLGVSDQVIIFHASALPLLPGHVAGIFHIPLLIMSLLSQFFLAAWGLQE